MKLIQKAIIKKGERFLILRRSPKATFFPSHWDFPGGKLEQGEDPRAGVEREVLEETGLHVTATAIAGTYDMVLRGIPHRFILYKTEGSVGDVRLSGEHTAYRWATREEILKLKTEPYIRKYFEEHSERG